MGAVQKLTHLKNTNIYSSTGNKTCAIFFAAPYEPDMRTFGIYLSLQNNIPLKTHH